MERSGTWQTDQHLQRLKAAVNMPCMKDSGEDDEVGTERTPHHNHVMEKLES